MATYFYVWMRKLGVDMGLSEEGERCPWMVAPTPLNKITHPTF